jgi:hypothetical protein
MKLAINASHTVVTSKINASTGAPERKVHKEILLLAPNYETRDKWISTINASAQAHLNHNHDEEELDTDKSVDNSPTKAPTAPSAIVDTSNFSNASALKLHLMIPEDMDAKAVDIIVHQLKEEKRRRMYH